MKTEGWEIPKAWRAGPGAVTPNGSPATFHSAPHAMMAVRLQYRREVMQQSDEEVTQHHDRYQQGWDQFIENAARLRHISELLDDGDVAHAASIWNDLDQVAIDAAFRVVLGERETYRRRNLVTHAWNFYGGPSPSPVPKAERDRQLRPSDNNAAWDRAAGICTGCGITTISHSQRDRLHRSMRSTGRFSMSALYTQQNGREAPLWSQVTIAAKGVAEHVEPACQGGRTTVANLTNVCAGCNYTRGDASLDAMSVEAQRRPASETSELAR